MLYVPSAAALVEPPPLPPSWSRRRCPRAALVDAPVTLMELAVADAPGRDAPVVAEAN
jgi:hypothetical protein